MYYLQHCTRDDAATLLDKIGAHLPADVPTTSPRIFQAGTVMINDSDERFAVEVDTETGLDFVTRARVTAPGENEITMWQNGRELDRRTQPITE